MESFLERLVHLEWQTLYRAWHPCAETAPLTMPAERTAFTAVPGKSGSLTTLEGDNVFDDLILTAV